MQPGNYAILHKTIDLLTIEPGHSKIYRSINIESLETNYRLSFYAQN
jgi:hypothetical protein